MTLKNNAATGSVPFFKRRACGASSWGADMLGGSLLFGGEVKSWTVEPGCYDFRATPAEVGLDYLYFNGVDSVRRRASRARVCVGPHQACQPKRSPDPRAAQDSQPA